MDSENQEGVPSRTTDQNEDFIKWIEASLKYLIHLVRSQTDDNIDRDWPDIPNHDISSRCLEKIQSISSEWKEYWTSCSKEIFVKIRQGIEQTHKRVYKKSGKADFILCEGVMKDVHNAHLTTLKHLWKTINITESEGSEFEREKGLANNTTEDVSDKEPKEKKDQNPISDPMEWMLSFLGYLNDIFQEKKVEHTITCFHDSWPLIPDEMHTSIGPLTEQLRNNWNFLWKKYLVDEENQLLEQIEFLDIILKSQKPSTPKPSKRVRKARDLIVYVLQGQCSAKPKETVNDWKTLLQFLHNTLQSSDTNDPDLPQWLEGTEESCKLQLREIIAVLKQTKKTLDQSMRETSVDPQFGILEFKANTMDIMDRFLRAEIDVNDVKPPVDSIRKLNKDDQKTQLQWFNDVKQNLQDLENKNKESERKLKSARTQVKQLEQIREELLNRLSQFAGAKLKENNPNITDLSDPNRPMKIGEQFSEIYDREWTSALEALCLKRKMEEEDAIKKLLQTVKDCYDFCVKTADERMSSFLMCDTSEIQQLHGSYLKSGELHHLHEIRKALAVFSLRRLQEDFFKRAVQETETVAIGEIKEKKSIEPQKQVRERKRTRAQQESSKDDKRVVEEGHRSDDVLASYTSKCLEVCWYMAIQSPQMYLDFQFKMGDSFDKSLLKHYTRNGTVVEFLVWPVMYLEQGGALLGKGVAQPRKT